MFSSEARTLNTFRLKKKKDTGLTGETSFAKESLLIYSFQLQSPRFHPLFLLSIRHLNIMSTISF